MTKAHILGFVIFCAAASASSGQGMLKVYDYDKPGFWDKKYNIHPDYAASYHVEISTSRGAERYAWQYLAQEGAKPMGGSFSNWAVPEGKAPELLQFILGLGRLRVYYRDRQEPVTAAEIEELEYKLRELRNEREVLAAHAGTIPGILGLLDAELRSLAAKLDSYNSGKGIVMISFSVEPEKKQ